MSLVSQLSALEISYLIQLESAYPELAYVFRHVLVRDAAYSTLVRRERQTLHQAVGEALEQLHSDEVDSLKLAPQLGAHFAEAGDETRALKYLTLAGDQAAGQFANREAAQYYARALELARRQPGADLVHLYLARGRALELSGDYSQALAGYEELEGQARGHSDEALEVEALAAQAHLRNVFTPVSDPVRGRAVVDRALFLARRLGNGAAEARLLLDSTRLYVWAGDTRQVIAAGEQAVASARRLGLRQLLVEGLIQLANWGYLNARQFRLARRGFEEAQELMRGLDAPQQRLDHLMGMFQVICLSGDFAQALALTAEIKRVSEAMSYGWGISQYHSFSASVHLEQGDLDIAIPHLEEAIRLGTQFSLGQRELITCAFLSRAYAAVGETEAGLAAVRQAYESLAPRLPLLLAWPLAAEGLLHLADGRTAEAAEAIAKARRVGESQNNNIRYRLLIQAEAELGLAQQEYAQVISLTDDVIRDMRAEGGRLVLCEALAYRGRALLGANDLEKAEASLRESRALAETVGMRPVLWRVLAALAELATRQGNQAQAQGLRREMRTWIEYLAERTGSPERRAGFLGTREVRAALREPL